MPAPQSPDKPAPVALQVGRQTLATAYARRAPTARKPDWEWRMSTHHPLTGERIMRSLGRLPLAEVEAALVAAYRAVDPSAVQEDGSGVRTVRDLLRAWLYDMEQRAPGGSRHKGDPISPLTLRNAETGAKRLVAVCGPLRLRTWRTGDVLRARDTLAERYAARTVRLDIKLLKQAAAWGAHRDVEMGSVDWAAVKVSVRDGEYEINHHTPTHADVECVYAGLRRCGLKLGLYVGWKTGARIGEITDLRWGDFFADADGHWVRLNGKTGERVFPLQASDLEVIRSFRPAVARDGARLFNTHFRKNGSAQLQLSCERREITPFTFHGLRRLMTDTMQRNGVEVGVYARLMGHSIEEALRVYRKPTAVDLQRVLGQLPPPGTNNEKPE